METSMTKTTTKTIETIKLKVDVTNQHIDEGECRLAHKCMEKVAVTEALIAGGYGKSGAELRVRVDAGHTKFNTLGHRWIADTHMKARNALIAFDHKEPVRPHSYTIVARRGAKLKKIPRSRQEQINEARRKREGNGNKPHKYTSIRKRIIGFTGGFVGQKPARPTAAR
jgi:hypothetical protein